MRVMADSVTVWTIGHSTGPIDDFLRRVGAHGITALADVRRFPGSRRHPQYGHEALDAALGSSSIEYASFTDLGGRRAPRPDSPNTAWRNASFRGYADFLETADGQAGLARLLALARTRPTVAMCAEGLWWRCHRALIADHYTVAGHCVLHIGPDGTTTPHPYTSAARIVDGRLSYAGDPSLGL
jgi:uncharacterized protein (DUF488 family)